jgi:Spy/CpxP family protein refolding chaperone
VEVVNWAGLALVAALLAVTAIGASLRTAEEPSVPANDPTRDPNWCWTHSQMWPACAPQHEEQK